jgi:hypothetical protein
MSSVGAEVLAHDRHFTYGENVGAPDRRFPTAGLRWRVSDLTPAWAPLLMGDEEP